MKHRTHTLTTRQLCDLELILNEGFAPLQGFLTQADYESVLHRVRLQNHALWPIPIVLDVTPTAAEKMALQDVLHLQDSEGHIVATMRVTDIYEPDKTVEAEAIYGTQDLMHPGVHYLFHQTQSVYLAGPVTAVNAPRHFDFAHYHKTPAELKRFFAQQSIERVVGFQTRNPMHRAHQELTVRAMEALDAHLLLHPVVGPTKPGDMDPYTRVKCYQLLLDHYPPKKVTLSLLPLAMRMAGPREALWHALIRKNYGCTHFIIGRDHAGPGKNTQGHDFYKPYEAQTFALEFSHELGIQLLPFSEMQYVKSKKCYLSSTEIAQDPSIQPDDVARLSGSELRHLLRTQEEIPEWFSYPNIIAQLRKAEPPLYQQGFTVFFTGLPSSGKSTLAKALAHKLMELTERTVSLFDGDLVRQLWANNLGFSKEDRDNHVKRMGYMAAEITKHRGIALCALIAPYAETRRTARRLVGQQGGFIEVYVATALTVCEARDPKGLYQKARAKEIAHFTGVSDPYEIPTQAELVLDTADKTVEACVETMMQKLVALGYLR